MVVGGASVVLAAVVAWVTLQAGFLAHPGWLAVQKADVIVGPVFVGLYWHRRRPRSRFGPLLIACALPGLWYGLQSLDDPVLFSLGLLAEPVIFIVSLTLVLAFPTGRLERWPERVLLVASVALVFVPYLAAVLVAPVLAPSGSISGCASSCPANGLLVSANCAAGVASSGRRPRKPRLDRARDGGAARLAAGIRDAAAAAGVPDRRAGGRPVPADAPPRCASSRCSTSKRRGSADALTWAVVISRSAVWYGFLFALIAAQLFAGRVLHRIVVESLRRPSLRDLEAMLRGPLGDPALTLAFARPDGGWVDWTAPSSRHPARAACSPRSSARAALRWRSCTTSSSPRSPSCCVRPAPSPCSQPRTRSSRPPGTARSPTCSSRAHGSSWPPIASGASSNATSTTACSSASSRRGSG